MSTDIRHMIIDEFSSPSAQAFYINKATEGLWETERDIIERYFTNQKGYVLDIGCGTGRTTLPLKRMGFRVLGVDLVPAMIHHAREIAEQCGDTIEYQVGDATHLKYDDNVFDYAIFSNQGWTQIPYKQRRMQALAEIRRVLKIGGIFIFTTHQRVWRPPFFFFWLRQWLRFFLLERWKHDLPEQDFGDRFFDRETSDDQRTYVTQQYIHIPSVREVSQMIRESGFQLVQTQQSIPRSDTHASKYPPVFFICKK